MINVNSGTLQGDAHLIGDRATGKTVLLDTGAPQEAEQKLLPYLRRQGVRELDAVLISHPHIDHYGGLVPLLKSEIQIRRIYMGPVPEDWVRAEWWGGSWDDLREIREQAARRGVPVMDYTSWHEYRFSDEFALTKLFHFNAQELSAINIGRDINELSLIAVLRYRRVRALFAGDMNNALSLWLVENHPEAVSCDLLKVPHHGAEGLADNEFFRKAAPRDALVPSPANLWESDRCARTRTILDALGSRVWVNGLHGHVTVNFSGDGYAVAVAP